MRFRKERTRLVHVHADFARQRRQTGALDGFGKRVAPADEMAESDFRRKRLSPRRLVDVERVGAVGLDVPRGAVGGGHAVEDSAAGEGLGLGGGIADEKDPVGRHPFGRANRNRPRTEFVGVDAVDLG